MRLAQTLHRTASGIVRRTLERGPLHACRWVRNHLHERAQERRLGIETAEFGSWKQSVGQANCHPYEPLAYHCIEAAIARVFPNSSGEVFLDYGSGKGRAVIVAALQPFRRAIGVELISELCEIARQNVVRAHDRLQCRNVEIHCCDATQFAVPEDVTCIYLYNPFWEDVLRSAQDRIRDSLIAKPRRLRIAYLLNEDQDDLFADCDWLQPTIRRHELWECVHLVAYESDVALRDGNSPAAEMLRQPESILT